MVLDSCAAKFISALYPVIEKQQSFSSAEKDKVNATWIHYLKLSCYMFWYIYNQKHSFTTRCEDGSM